MVNSTICVMFYTDKRYEKLAKVAKNSFLSFNPSIPVFLHTSDSASSIFGIKEMIPAGVRKLMIALAQAKKLNSKKVIILGCDTITCSELQEFLIYEEDILCTLDYPYQLVTPRVSSPDSQTHVNADVVCFNNLKALEDTIRLSLKHDLYFEQGGLNEILWSGNYMYSNRIIDFPYIESTVVYNARAKGNLCAKSGERPWAKFTNLFHAKDDKLFTGLHENNPTTDKQIKIWHYCDGLGTMDKDSFQKRINWWIDVGFNQQTKDFFTNYCNSGNFFNEKFKI